MTYIDEAASEFDIAVQKLVSVGIDKTAARQLINNAVDRPGSLSSWADHLIEQKRKYAELEQRFPRSKP